MKNEMIISDGFGGTMVKKDLLRGLLARNKALSDAMSYLLDVPHTGEYVSLDKIADLMKGAIGREGTSKTLYCLTCTRDSLPDLVLSDDPIESDIARARLGLPTKKVASYSDILRSRSLDTDETERFSMSSFLGVDSMNTQKIVARRASRLSAKSGRQLV